MLGIWVKRPSSLSMTLKKCFDSLWLQDCINALWDNGIQDDSFYFIYLLSKKAHTTINTALGRTGHFVSENVVKKCTFFGLC